MVRLSLRVLAFRVETPRTRILRLGFGAAPFPFAAGQAANLSLHGQPLAEPYSIACAPAEADRDRALSFLIQMEDESGVASHLAGVRPGDLVDVEGPRGGFVLERDPGAGVYLFVAGGTGVAPLRAMLVEVRLSQPGADVTLVYSARSPEEFAFGSEFRAMARSGQLQLRETVTRSSPEPWAGRLGRIRRTHLDDLVAGRQPWCFVCGPPGFAPDVRGILVALGVRSDRIRTESWG